MQKTTERQSVKKELLRKIEQKEARVGIIGIGYIGLPLLNLFVENGFHAIGVDLDAQRVDALLAGHSYIRHIPDERITKSLATGRLQATSDFAQVAECDVIILTVPTPLNKNKEPDMSYIVSSSRAVAAQLRKGQVVILESTTYPGTTVEVVVPILEEAGLRVDQDIYVGYSPEREDPNNPKFHTANIPKVVSATSPEGLEVVDLLYRQVVEVTVPVSSPQVAEASKLLENIFRSVNIALVNELKTAFHKMGINVWETIEAASSKPFGFMPFYPGPGIGGHCIPADPFYLSWKAKEYNVYTRFIELAGEINTSMPEFVVNRVIDALNDVGKSLKGARILVLGVAYKPNVDDDRDSPSYPIMLLLEEKGGLVSYNDPYIPEINPAHEYLRFKGKKSVDISPGYDLILITTAHDEYKDIDFDRFSIQVVDTRHLIKEEFVNLYRA